MFFEKRRWALKLTDSMGLPPSSREAAEITKLVLYGAKLLGGMPGNKLTNPQKVVLAAMQVSINESAREVLAERLTVTTTAAWNLQMRLKVAAERMAKLAGLPDDDVDRP